MGAVGLNGASSDIDDKVERAKIAADGWARWAPVNAAARAWERLPVGSPQMPDAATSVTDLDDFLSGARVDAAVFGLRPDYRALLLAVDGLIPAPSPVTM